MPENPSPSVPKFDAYAGNYRDLHKAAVAASGEDPGYFARYKLECLERLVSAGWNEPVLDYGCGIGQLTRQLVTRFSNVTGYDPSGESLSVAAQEAPAARFVPDVTALPEGHFGLAVLAGVLHHVPPHERPALVRSVAGKLQPGSGKLVVFEHNPWNPLTRRSVAACPFDDDAILLPPFSARRLIADNGFETARLSFITFFPKAFARLRFLEPHLAFLPLGAQVMVVATRPA